MASPPEQPIASFADAQRCVAEQIMRYQELLVLLEMEEAALCDENQELLHAILAQKQQLIDAIVAEEQRLNPFRTMVPSANHERDVVDYLAMANDLCVLMQEAVKSQRANEGLLAGHMAQVREKLRSMQQGRETLSAYGTSLRGTRYGRVPRFIDRQS